MALLTYIHVYAQYFFGAFAFLFPGIISYKQFVLITSFVTAAILAKEIIKGMAIPRAFLVLSIIFLFVLFNYRIITPIIYDSIIDNNYNGSFLCLAGQIFPSALNACLVAFNEDVQRKMKRMTPYISVIFSVVALLCTINPSGETSGNLISNEENGFGYQTVSYVAAFSSALAEYYLLNKNNVEQSFIFKKQLGNILAIAVIFVDFLITLLSGGRGGFVTYFVFLAASFFFYAKTNKINFSTIVKAFFAVFVIVCLGFGAVKIAENSALSTSGFSRIMGFISGGGDEGRAALREQALQMFLRKPLFGNGLGSVYYELGIYSHNFFTDVLAETGIVGLIFFVSLFIYTFYCSVRIVRVDKSDLLWIYILIGGFIFSMFSGYYLTREQLWLELIFIICKYRYNRLVGR